MCFTSILRSCNVLFKENPLLHFYDVSSGNSVCQLAAAF